MSVDSFSLQAVKGDLTGANPIDRGKAGSKLYVAGEADGLPLSAILSAADACRTFTRPNGVLLGRCLPRVVGRIVQRSRRRRSAAGRAGPAAAAVVAHGQGGGVGARVKVARPPRRRSNAARAGYQWALWSGSTITCQTASTGCGSWRTKRRAGRPSSWRRCTPGSRFGSPGPSHADGCWRICVGCVAT